MSGHFPGHFSQPAWLSTHTILDLHYLPNAEASVFLEKKEEKKKFGGRYLLCWVTCLCCDKKQQLYEKYHTRFYPNKARTQGGSDSGFQVILLLNSLRSRLTGWWQCDGTLCRFPLESPRKAMVCPALTLTATAVRRADGLSSMVSASTATLLAMGLGVWSEPQG